MNFTTFAMLMVFASTSVIAAEKTKVYEVNKYGQTQYHKPSLVIKKDTVYEVNKYGQTQYHKPALKVKKTKD